MKKFSCIFLCLLMLLSLLCGCGSSADMATDSAKKEEAVVMQSTSSSSMKAEMDYGYAYDNAAPMEQAVKEEMAAETTTEAGGGSNPALANAKLIYTADISLQTTEFDAAVEKLNTLVAGLGGYFERSSVDNYSSYRYGSYTVRVPAEAFESFCNQVGQLCQVNYISKSAEDISESYYDTESRLVTQRTKLERLQALLAKAENMEDIITLESAISETEWQIENLTGTLRRYDSLVGYSTIYLSLDEVYKIEEVEQPVIGFGAKLANAFQRGCNNFVDGLEDMALSLAYNWVGWAIFLVIAAVVIVVAVRRVRRWRQKKYAVNEEKNADEM